MRLYTDTRLHELDAVPWNDDQKRAFIEMQFRARNKQYDSLYPQAHSTIILYGDEPVGRMLVDRSGREIVLIDIALMLEHRNAGIGTRLITGLMNEAASTGQSIRLHVLATSAAVRLYERLGFSRGGSDGAYLEMNWRPPLS